MRALIQCAARTARLLRQGRLHLPAQRVGMVLRFGEGAAWWRLTAVG